MRFLAMVWQSRKVCHADSLRRFPARWQNLANQAEADIVVASVRRKVARVVYIHVGTILPGQSEDFTA